jgi:hypothetical protein
MAEQHLLKKFINHFLISLNSLEKQTYNRVFQKEFKN